jgi:uncharacterized Tic20 family protein
MGPTISSDLPPAGWYSDPTGQLRWWDGSGWTAAAASRPGSGGGTSPKTMGMLAHLGGLVGGWLVPLIVYLVDGGKDRFVRHNASEGLNFQLTLLIANLVFLVPFFAIFLVPFLGATGAGLAVGGFIVYFVASFGLLGVNLGFSIMGMVKASRGEWWEYPVRIRFVKGFCPPEERYTVV